MLADGVELGCQVAFKNVFFSGEQVHQAGVLSWLVKTQRGAEMPGVGFCPGWHSHKPHRTACVFQERNAV